MLSLRQRWNGRQPTLSSEGRQVTERHRRSQLALRSVVGRQLLSVWRTEFDIDNIAGSSIVFAQAAVPVLEDGKRRSAEMAAAYFSQFRQVDGPGLRRARPMADVDGRRVQNALGYSAKIVPLKAIRNGSTPAQAARAGLQQSIGTASRLVADGARETLTTAVDEDPQARGWQRVTGPNPCEFCAMLSARGGVYRTQGRAEFEAHSGRGSACQCDAEPVYDERWLSPDQQRFKDLYDREAKGTDDPLKAFRAAYRREIQPAA